LVAIVQANTSGAPDATEKIISEFTGLISRQAFSCHHPHIYDDLVQEGRIALLAAINNFNPSRRARFSTYATTCIRNRMISYAIRETAHFYNKDRRRIYPGDRSAAERSDVPPTTLEELASDGSSEADMVELLHLRRYQERLQPALSSLPVRQRQALTLHFRNGKPAAEVATTLNVSRPRVTALIQAALERMRRDMEIAA